ncbi:MAG: Fe2+-dependent dioxygenase [Lysobacterales bacterium]
MIQQLSSVLAPAALTRLRALAETLEFVDGRLTNPDSTVKRNEQVAHTDQRAAEAGLILRDALIAHPQLSALTWPRQIARPTLVRYQPGMTYGWHVDAAMFASQPPMRSDISCTVFISEPDEYAGGELEFEWGGDVRGYKLAAGDAILYPSTTIHRVAPVTHGVRLVGISWLQSFIADAHRRDLLNQVDELRGLGGSEAQRERAQVLLESVRTNLFRMWSDT